MSEFKKYVFTKVVEIREYVPGEDLSKVTVYPGDNARVDLGMIARNPDGGELIYMNRKYFQNNFEKAPDEDTSGV